jgi:stringent starvation protein B
MNRDNVPSTRPYLIRALHEWCTENGFTPYIAVAVDDTVQVPREFVKNNEVVLNTSLDATSHLQLGNEFVSFKARFSGVAREVLVPVDHVIAIYARENGQGMAFPAPQPAQSGAEQPVQVPPALQVVPAPATAEHPDSDPPSLPGGPAARPKLKRVK